MQVGKDDTMKVLASDYDGTLCIDHVVSKENIQAIQKFRQAGNMFGIVTGRSVESLVKELDKYQITCDFIITNNGGVLCNEQLEKLSIQYMDKTSVLNIIAYLKETTCISYVVNDGVRRYKFVNDANTVDHKYGSLKDDSAHEDKILQEIEVAQMVVSLPDDHIAHEIAAYCNKHYDEIEAYVNTRCVDIVAKGVSKAKGIKQMCRYLHMQEDCVYAIGDSYNDLPMLQAFHGCTLQHANQDIKEEAEYIFDSVAACITYIMK